MKKFKYSIGFLLFALVMSMSYYLSYEVSKNDKEKIPVKEQDMISAGQIPDQKVKKEARYIIETYDKTKRTISQKEFTLPQEFIGLSRDELVQHLEEYKAGLFLESGEGLEGVSLTSFSPDRVILRQTYEGNYEFFLKEDEGQVVVYFKDKKTIYEKTPIMVDTLPQKVQEEIKKGKYIEDDHTLFEFLENYSS